MTRDEHRAACIEAVQNRLGWHGINQEVIHAVAVDLFDSLHGLARVNQIEATEEMVAAMNIHSNTSPENTFRVMARKGDLTNPPKSEEPSS